MTTPSLSPKQQATLPRFVGGMTVTEAQGVDKRTLKALMDRDLVIFDEPSQKYYLAEEAPAQSGSIRMLIDEGKRRMKIVVLNTRKGTLEVLNVQVEAHSSVRIRELRNVGETLKFYNEMGYQFLTTPKRTETRPNEKSSRRRKPPVPTA